MQLIISKGDKLPVKIGKRFKKHEVISYDPSDGWIIFKSNDKDCNDFTLSTKMHKNHIKVPEAKKVKVPIKKKRRKKKK
tara:strand:- start:163 stop:399 length:237 start_codon:yes stop_codon:yes gene_type:complete